MATQSLATDVSSAPLAGAAPRAATLLPRWLLRRSPAGPLLLYLLLAVGVVAPFWRDSFRGVGDLYAVIGSIVEAKNAFREGQFPIRVPPAQLHGTRYPIFSFYGNFPYTLGGGIYAALPVNPYTAWRITSVLMLVIGGFYAYRCALQFTRRDVASVLAGAVFITAPYMLADVWARGAFTEFVAFNLMPVVLFYAWRSFVSPRLRYVLAGGIAWALVAFSHNITYLYGVVFVGLFFLLQFRPNRKYFLRLGRVVCGGALHALLAVWYVIPQMRVLDDLMISAGTSNPMVWSGLTTLGNLMRLRAFTPEISTTANLSLQLGAPMTASILLAALCLFTNNAGWRGRWMTLRLLAVFALAFLLVWSPFDVWRFLPKVMQFVQFPYRVLIFVVLFGAMLTACGFGFLGRGVRAWQAVLLMLPLGVSAGTYVPHDKPYNDQVIAKQTVDPKMGGLEDYLLSTPAAARTSLYPSGLNMAGDEFAITEDGILPKPISVTIPTPQNAEALVFAGTLLPDTGNSVEFIVLLGGKRFLQRIMPGPFEVSVPVEGPTGRRPLTLVVDALSAAHTLGHVEISYAAFEPLPRAPGERLFISAPMLKPAMRYGKWSGCTVDATEPVLAQIPVIYYPGLLCVRDNGREIPYANIGRYLAVELEPGRHEVLAEFVGVRWANRVSLIAWVLTLGALLLLWRRDRRRAARSGSRAAGQAGRQRRGFSVIHALLGGLFVALGVVGVQAYPTVAKYFDGSIRIRAYADSVANKDQVPDNAFDNDPATEWAAKGSNPATLSIGLNHPAMLRGIDMDSRKTSLYEAWHRMRVRLFLKKQQVLEQEYFLPDAYKEPTAHIQFPPTMADRVEIHFWDPVVIALDGKRIPANAVSPGYREIRLQVAPK